MFVIILFCSILLWFLLGNLRDPSELPPINETEPLLEELEMIEDPRIEKAIRELKQVGCELVFIEPRVYLDKPHNVAYDEFKSKALERNLVVVTPSDYGIILLVQIKKEQWIWVPS